MKEALFILAVIIVLLALTAIRYRKQIAAMLQVWRMIRSVRLPKGAQEPAELRAEKNMGRLVNCSKCGEWIPEKSAVKLGGRSYFCSAKCLEETANLSGSR